MTSTKKRGFPKKVMKSSLFYNHPVREVTFRRILLHFTTSSTLSTSVSSRDVFRDPTPCVTDSSSLTGRKYIRPSSDRPMSGSVLKCRVTDHSPVPRETDRVSVRALWIPCDASPLFFPDNRGLSTNNDPPVERLP